MEAIANKLWAITAWVHRVIKTIWEIIYFPVAVVVWMILTGILAASFFCLYYMFYRARYDWQIVDENNEFYLKMIKKTPVTPPS